MSATRPAPRALHATDDTPGAVRTATRTLDGSLEVHVAGEWCLESSPQVVAALDRAAGALPSPERLVVDLTGLAFADSTAVAGLVDLARRAQARRLPLTVLVAPGPVARLVVLTGVGELLGAVPATATATAAAA